MCALENNAEWDLVVVDLRKGEQKSAAHLARQPFGQIPAIQDGDLSFYESRAITRYVNETRGGKLTPASVGDRARMEQWISLEQGTISPDVAEIVKQRVFTPMFGGKADEEIVKKHAEKAKVALDVMNKHLERYAFLAGESFSLADVFYMSVATQNTSEAHLRALHSGLMLPVRLLSELS